MQARGITHVERDLARERRDGARDAIRNDRGVAHDHEHGHGLTDGTPHTQDNCIDDAQLGCRKHDLVDGLPLGGTHGIGCLANAHGNGIEGIDGERGDGGDDHDGEHEPRRQCAKSKAAGQLGDKRTDDDHAKEAVDNGGDARQQVDGRADEPAHALAGNLDQIHGCAHTQRHAHGERADRHQARARQQRHNAVVTLRGRPRKAKEVRQTDVGKDRQRRVRGKDKNQDDGDDRQERAGKEDPLQRLLLKIGAA